MNWHTPKLFPLLFCITLATAFLKPLSGQITTDDPLFTNQWWLSDANLNINVSSTWTQYTGAGVGIAIYDTGVNNHEDLIANIDRSIGLVGDGPDSFLVDPLLTDHGTVVASVAAGVDNALGGMGVAPHATIYDFDLGSGGVSINAQNTTDYIAGAGVDINGNYLSDASIHVRNHSYGLWDILKYTQTFAVDLLPAFAAAANNNVIDVKSSGNGRIQSTISASITANGNSAGDWDNNSPFMIVVGATNQSDTFASFSSFGSNLFVSAPGTNIVAAIETNDYTDNGDGIAFTNDDVKQGTSFSAPMVTGAIALAKQAVPDANTWLIKHALARGSDLIDATDSSDVGGWVTNAAGFSFNNNYGFGKLNVGSLVTNTLNAAYVTKRSSHTTATNPGLTFDGTGQTTTIAVDAPDGTEQGAMTVLLTIGFGGVTTADLDGAIGTITSPSGTTHQFLFAPDTASVFLFPFTSWTFAVNGFWGEAIDGNWQVSITSPNDFVTWSQADLQIYHGDYVAEGGPITFAADENIYSLQLDQAASSVTVNGGITLSTEHDIRLNAGSLNNMGIIQSDGFKAIELVMNNVNGAPSFTNSGTATFNGGITSTGGSINNSGTLATTGNVNLTSSSFTNSGDFDAAGFALAASTFTNTSTADMTGSTTASQQSSITNQAGGTFNTVGMTINNSSLSNSGTMTLTTYAASNGSALNNAAGASLTTGTYLSQDSSTTNAGMLDLLTGSMTHSGGTLSNSGTLSNVSSLSLTNAVFSNSGTADIGSINQNGGAASNSGGTINNLSTLTILNGGSFDNRGGTLNFTPATSLLDLQSGSLMDSGNTINNLATLQIGASGSVTHEATGAADTTLATNINNQGSLTVTRTHSLGAFTGGNIVTSGQFTFNGPTLTLTGTLDNSGELTLNNSGGAVTVNADTLTLHNSSNLGMPLPTTPHQWNANNITIDGNLTILGGGNTNLINGQSVAIIEATGAGQFASTFDDIFWEASAVPSLIFEFVLDPIQTNSLSVTMNRNFLNKLLLPLLNESQRSLGASLNAIDAATGVGSTEESALNRYDQLGSIEAIHSAMNQTMPISAEVPNLLAREAARGQMQRISRTTRNNWARQRQLEKARQQGGFKALESYDQLASQLLDNDKAIEVDNVRGSYFVVENNKTLDASYAQNYRLGFGFSGRWKKGNFTNTATFQDVDFANYALSGHLALELGKNMMIGVLFGADRGFANTNDLNNEVDAQIYTVGAFLSGTYASFYSDVAFAYSFIDYDLQRNVNFSGLNESFRSDAKGRQYTGYARTGFDVHVTPSFSFGPSVGIQYMNWKMNGYNEPGNSFFALETKDVDADSIWVDVAANFSYFHSWEAVQLMANFTTGFTKNVLDEEYPVRADFRNARGSQQFTTLSVDPNNGFMNFGAGLQLTILQNTSVNFNAGYNVGEDFDAYSLEASVGHRL